MPDLRDFVGVETPEEKEALLSDYEGRIGDNAKRELISEFLEQLAKIDSSAMGYLMRLLHDALANARFYPGSTAQIMLNELEVRNIQIPPKHGKEK